MRTTILDIQRMKRAGQRIPMVTAYDATGARWLDEAGIPMLLVGDSLGMVVQGHETTVPVTLDDMVYHTRMVVRGSAKALIVTDLPFMSYKISAEQALSASARAMQEGGAGAVKLEGGTEIAATVARIVTSGIPVMAHIGLTPQSYHQLGGWRAQGKELADAHRLLEDAVALEAAGAFAIVLETIPVEVAAIITARLTIPTIGIGAGAACDGQVQVFHDMLGLSGRLPRHAKAFADLGTAIREAASAYAVEVAGSTFPAESHTLHLDENTRRAFEDGLQPTDG